MPVVYKSYIGKCRLIKHIVQTQEHRLDYIVFHIGVKVKCGNGKIGDG